MVCIIRILRASIVGLGVIGLASCGGGGTEPTLGVASVTVSPNTLNMLLGMSEQLNAVARNDAAAPIVGATFDWTTSAPSVATVTSAGVVTAVGAGSATISAAHGGKTANVSVSVSTVSFASVATGGAHSCALTTAGAAWCWGRSELSQLGVKPPSRICLTVEVTDFPCLAHPVSVQGGLTFTRIVGAEASNCALTSDGTAYCWGGNHWGQLGDNSTGNVSTTQRAAPGAVVTSQKFVSLTAGNRHFCGLTANGAAYCWGHNGLGQLGDGTTTHSSVPVAVSGGLVFKSITAGAYGAGITCGITTNDDAYCWGENLEGQLGIGSKDQNAHPAPGLVSGGLKWAALDAGLGPHMCGIAIGGAAYCWGINILGALGDGTTTQRLVPTAVAGGLSFVQITAGGFAGQDHSCALTSAGKAYCWGDNEAGAVGDGTTELQRLSPTAVAGNLTFTSLDAGLRHTCGQTSTGRVYCWGSGRTGQIGSGEVGTAFREPTKVVGQQ